MLASRGILMQAIHTQAIHTQAIHPQLVLTVLMACRCYLAAVDFLKIGLLRTLPQRLCISHPGELGGSVSAQLVVSI